MPQDQIQGRNTTLRIYLNGRFIDGFPITNFRWRGEDEIRRRDLVGHERSQRQHLIHGYQGQFEFDVSSGRHHEIVDFLNLSDKSGVPNYELAIQVRENYRDGSSKRYRFVRVSMRIPEKNVQGRREDVSGTIEWEAEDIIYLN